MNNIEKYLSLGTVVLLREGKHKMMIIGYCVVPSSEDRKIMDYIGCLYPEGLLKLDQTYAFNHKDIEKIFFEGYSSLEDQIFKENLKKFVSENVNSDGILNDNLNNMFKENIGG